MTIWLQNLYVAILLQPLSNRALNIKSSSNNNAKTFITLFNNGTSNKGELSQKCRT